MVMQAYNGQEEGAPDPQEPVAVHEQKCGCVVRVFANGIQHYEPCLPHALDHAGKMLQAAASKIGIFLSKAQQGPRIVRAKPGDIPPAVGGRPNNG